MTIATQTCRVVGLGNGTTTVFDYDFLIPAASYAVVTYTDASGVATVLQASQYSITGINDANGGTVTYPLSGSPIATGTSLTIERVLPLQQTTSIINLGGFFPQVIEAAFDFLTMISQQLNRLMGRALLVAASDDTPAALPPAAQRANKYLAFDASGNPIPSGGTGTDTGLRGDLASTSVGLGATLIALRDAAGNFAATTVEAAFAEVASLFARLSALAASSGSSLVGFLQAGTGAVQRSVQDELRDVWVKPEQFGAVGDGTTDDYAAIMRAHNALPATGGIIQLSAKGYKFASSLVFTKPVTLRGVTRENGTGTRLFKASTLNGPGIQTSVSHVTLQDFALAGQAGNGGDGIVVTSTTAVLRGITVTGMGQDGVRVGDTSGTNSNLWSIDGLETYSNGRHGFYADSSTTNAGGGTASRLYSHDNAGDGIKIDRAQLNTFNGIVSENNIGYGVNIASGARDNLFFGGDSEANTAGNLLKDTAAIRNNIFATWGSFTLGARVFNSINESINSASFTTLTFDSERFDTDAIHNTSVNTSRLTIQTAGKYLVGANVGFSANATGVRYASIKKNGTTNLVTTSFPGFVGDTNWLNPQTVVDLAVGDYIEVEVYQNSGAPLDVVQSDNRSPEFFAVRQN